jgi:hypothetical protein
MPFGGGRPARLGAFAYLAAGFPRVPAVEADPDSAIFRRGKPHRPTEKCANGFSS